MHSDWDDISQARHVERQRRQRAAERKRQRIKQVRRARRMLAAGILLVIVIVSVLLMPDRIEKQHNATSSLDVKETLQLGVNAEGRLVAETPEPVAIVYPTKSIAYIEVDEAVKSPYVALLDVEKRQIIAGRDCDEKIYPASMTKVMTLIVAVETLKDLNSQYTFSAEEIYPLVQAEASRAGFDPGEAVGLNDLFYGLILPSGADAAVALAKMTAGSEEAFAEMMNEKCQELGLKATHFVNASGLHDENQYTTPVEMAVIMEYAMQNETCAKVLSTYQYTTQPTQQHPEGILLTSTMFSRMYGTEVEGVTILSGKTGYTDEARNCLVSYAQKEGKHYVAVTAYASGKWNCIFDDFEIYKNYLPV